MATQPPTRLLFLSPSVIKGAEPEPQITDFESFDRKTLGEGAFGTVYKVKHKVSGNVFALKVILKEKVQASNMLPQLRREIRIMYSLTHPHIIKLINHFEDDRYFYLILELALGGTLWQRLAKFGGLDENAAAQYFRELILAVEYLHSREPPIIHRDIKPENLLLTADGPKGKLKVADFGWSNFFNDDRSRQTYCGTLDYLAPEMIAQQGHGTPLDIWNLGVLLFELLTGQAPFQAPNQRVMFEKIKRCKIDFPLSFPPMAKDLVQRLMRPDPSERIRIGDIVKHPWMMSHPPIRPTLTQSLTKDPLPCGFEPTSDEPPLSDPIKPFEDSEVQVISQPNSISVLEESKSPRTPVVLVRQDSLNSRSIIRLEGDSKAARAANSTAKTDLDSAQAELAAIDRKIAELEGKLSETTAEYVERKASEQRLTEQVRLKAEELEKLAEIESDSARMYASLDALKSQFLEKSTSLSVLSHEIEQVEVLDAEKDAQVAALEAEVQRIDEEVDQAKVNLMNLNAEMSGRMVQLNSEVKLLHQELQAKSRGTSSSTLESLVEFVQTNLESLMNRSRREVELLNKFSEKYDHVSTLELQYTDLRVRHEEDLAALKFKAETEILETERRAQSMIETTEQKSSDIEKLRQILNEGRAAGEAEKAAEEEERILQEHSSCYELSVKNYRRQIADLEYLCNKDEDILRAQSIQLENYEIEIEKYRRQIRLKQ
jgi:serine/threonine protein kinase